jgi:peroxiredoxin
MSSSDSHALREAFDACRNMEGSLGDRLEAFAASLRTIDPVFSNTVDRLVERLQKADVGVAAPAVGDGFPPFYLPDAAGRIVSLGSLLEEGPVAVVLHRGHWCPYCRINAYALAEALPRVRTAGGRLVAITPDRQSFAKTLHEEADAAFPILTDMDNGYAMSLNLVFWLGDEMRKAMLALGIDLVACQGNDSWTLPVPATFVVSQDGRVKARFVDPDFRKRMAIENMIEACGSSRSMARR